MLRAIVGLVVLAVSAVALPAVSATAAPVDRSCVDTNHNGWCDPGEPAFASLVDANGAYNGSGDVVLDNFVVSKLGTLVVNTTGNITFRDKLSNLGQDAFVSFTAGTIHVEPKANLRIGGDLALHANKIQIDDKAQLMAANDNAVLLLDAPDVTTGASVKLQEPGHEGELQIIATNGLTFGKGTQLHTDQRATLHVTTYSDLVADQLHVQAGDMLIEALSNAQHPGPRHITLTDSVVYATYDNGMLVMHAGPESPLGMHTAGDSITFVNGSANAHHKGNVEIDPDPTFMRTRKH